MPAIFVDASALVPMAVMNDEWRPSLLRVMEGLRRAGQPAFVTTNWTLYEALGRCGQASGELAHALREASRTWMRVAPVTSRVEQAALAAFLGSNGTHASVVDHAGLIVALQTGCEAVLTFNREAKPLVRGAGLRLLD